MRFSITWESWSVPQWRVPFGRVSSLAIGFGSYDVTSRQPPTASARARRFCFLLRLAFFIIALGGERGRGVEGEGVCGDRTRNGAPSFYRPGARVSLPPGLIIIHNFYPPSPTLAAAGMTGVSLRRSPLRHRLRSAAHLVHIGP